MSTEPSTRTTGPGLAHAANQSGLRTAWRTVAIREITVRISDRTFILSTLFMMALLVGVIAFNSFVGKSDTTSVVAGDSQAEAILKEAKGAHLFGDEDLEVKQVDDAEAAKNQVTAKDADFALYRDRGTWTLVSRNGGSSGSTQQIISAIGQVQQERNAQEAGVPSAELKRDTQVHSVALDPDGKEAKSKLLGYIFGFLFYMSALTFGMALASSVLEEKQNRIVEIIATAIPMSQLLIGKLVGNLALAFGQLAFYAVAGLTAVNLFDVGTETGWILSTMGWFVPFFILGLVVLSSVWAVVGSMASRLEDLNASTIPLQILLLIVFLGSFTVSGTIQAILSYVPVFSSILMPMRLTAGAASWWEAGLAILIGLIAVALMVAWGSKAYRRAVMRTGEAITWKQLVKGEY